jgi:3-methylcrotonyl-CoA carboxylase alpha subunit
MDIYTDGRVQHEIDIRQKKEANGKVYFTVTIDGFPYKVTANKLIDGRIEITHNNKTFKCFITEEEDERHVFFDGHSFKLKKIESGTMLTDEEGLVANKVVAPMPGVIIKYLVSTEDKVKVNQKLLIIEAMKMQNTLVAPYAGTIKELCFKEGDQVDEGAELIIIEKEEIDE